MGCERTETLQWRTVAGVILALLCFAFQNSGADSSADPCLSAFMSKASEAMKLTEAQRRECRAWAMYAGGLYKGFAERDMKPLRKAVTEALLLNPEDETLREKWGELYVGRGRSEKKLKAAAAAYEPIWAAAPLLPANILFYHELLNTAGEHKRAADLLKESLKKTGDREGTLVREYVLGAVDHGKPDELLEYLQKVLAFPDLRDRTAVEAAAACCWLVKEMRLDDQLSGAGKKKAPKDSEEREKLRRQGQECRNQALALVKRLNLSEVDEKTARIVAMVYERYACWSDLRDAVRQYWLKCKETHLWPLEMALKAAERLDDYSDVYAFIDKMNITLSWPPELLKRLVAACLKSPDKLEEAIVLQRMLVDAQPKQPGMRLFLALLLYRAEAVDECLEELGRLRPDDLHWSLRVDRNNLLENCGKLQEAYDDYSQILFQHGMAKGHDGLSGYFYYRFASLCFKMGKREQSLVLAKRCWESDQNNAAYANFYGYSLADMDRELPLALKLIQFALSKEPESVAYLDSLAWVYFRQGNARAALQEMLKVVELGGLDDDPDGEISSHLSEIFGKLGLKGTARFYRVEEEPAGEEGELP